MLPVSPLGMYTYYICTVFMVKLIFEIVMTWDIQGNCSTSILKLFFLKKKIVSFLYHQQLKQFQSN